MTDQPAPSEIKIDPDHLREVLLTGGYSIIGWGIKDSNTEWIKVIPYPTAPEHLAASSRLIQTASPELLIEALNVAIDAYWAGERTESRPQDFGSYTLEYLEAIGLATENVVCVEKQDLKWVVGDLDWDDSEYWVPEFREAAIRLSRRVFTTNETESDANSD